MSIRRFSSRTHRLDASFLMQHLTGAQSYKRIAGYFTSSLFEVAGEALEHIPEVKIVCNVDIHPDDLKVAQLRESKILGRWNERALEAARRGGPLRERLLPHLERLVEQRQRARREHHVEHEPAEHARPGVQREVPREGVPRELHRASS